MATINKTTQLFEGLTDQEAKDLQMWVEAVMLRGFLPTRPPLVDQWLDEMSLEESLLNLSTVVPQKILMSLLMRRDSEFGEVCKELHVAPFSGHDGVMEAIRSLTDALDMALGSPGPMVDNDKSNGNETSQGT